MSTNKDADGFELRKRIARLVYSYREWVSDEMWEEVWKFQTDPNITEKGGPWHMDEIVNDIIALVRVNVLRGTETPKTITIPTFTPEQQAYLETLLPMLTPKTDWREELANIFDMIGTRAKRLDNEPIRFMNLQEIIYQLRKKPVEKT